MNEKGNIQLFFAGVIFFFGVLAFGWWLGLTFGNFSDIKPESIEIEPKGTRDGEIRVSTITVNNCQSSVDSMAHESREFVYQHVLSFGTSNGAEIKIHNAIAFRLQQENNFQNGSVFKVMREFDFVSPAGKITLHKIEWREKLSEGIARFRGREYQYSYPIDIEVFQSSEHLTCPTP